MRSAIKFSVFFSCLAATVSAFAGDLAPGSKAPALDVKTWYKGSPIKNFDAEKIYVVEFWATWCGPCKTSIPHLTELAKANPKIPFIGVSIWEDDKQDNIKNFVKSMGSKMDYNVGYSGNKTGMSETWMKASSQNGIPTAFIIKNQQVQWIGHPMDMAKPLEEVKSGKFDIKKFKAEYEKSLNAQKAQESNRKELAEITTLIKSAKYDEAETRLDALEETKTAQKEAIEELRFLMLAKTNPSKWEILAHERADRGTAQDKDILCTFAFRQVNEPGGDLDKAKIAIECVLSAAKEEDLIVFYNVANYYEETKQPKKAIEMVDKALLALPKSTMKDNKEIKEMLVKYREELAKKAQL